MKSYGQMRSGLYSLIGACLLGLLLPGTGWAVAYTNVWRLDVITNYGGSDYPGGTDYLLKRAFVQANGRWGIGVGAITNVDGQNSPQEGPGYYLITFLRLNNFYQPAATSLYLTADTTNTCRYVPYTNTLTVTIAGTSSNVVWSFDSYPGELTNSSAYRSSYTNDATLFPVPTGTYSIIFPPVDGYTTPGLVSTVVTGAGPHSITGTYTALPPGTYTLTVNLYPIRAVVEGAKWMVDNDGVWRDHAASVALGTSNQPHAIQYKDVIGYFPPFYPTNGEYITLTSNSNISRTYDRTLGTITVIVTPTNGSWVFTDYPNDYTTWSTSPLFGNGGTNYLSNAPLGSYTIHYNPLEGYTAPPDQTQSNWYATISNTWYMLPFYGNYILGYKVDVHIQAGIDIDPPSGFMLLGKGTGGYTVSTEPPGRGILVGSNWYFSSNTVVTLTAIPTPGGQNFFYEWYDPAALSITTITTNNAFGERFINPNTNITFTIHTNDVSLWLLFSRAFNSYDNVGDVDLDFLPDEWEKSTGVNPKDDGRNLLIGDVKNGRNGNDDEDFIPSLGNTPPVRVWITTNNTIVYLSAFTSAPSYPLVTGYASSNIAFNNALECRGPDTYYKTNGPTGTCIDDDPYTLPLSDDTNGDGLPDGWEYYFWRWRSASAYNAGLTNSSNLGWVRISPSDQREPIHDGAGDDTDGDGFSNGDECARGTDPTSADTDGDFMDDYWENKYSISNACNPLNANDGNANVDNDYYASFAPLGTNGGLYALTNGMSGTLLATQVCYQIMMTTNSVTNPIIGALEGSVTNTTVNITTNVWIDAPANGVFDIFRDKIICASSNNGGLLHLSDGTPFSHPVYYLADTLFIGGVVTNVTGYQDGCPVFVDVDDNGVFSDDDIALVNPFRKHFDLYRFAVTNPGPGVTSFDPRVGWNHTNKYCTLPFVNSEEYKGRDFLGRIAWDAAGKLLQTNDFEPIAPGRLGPFAYSDPSKKDGDNDGMPDGWEFYVNLNPNDPGDAGEDYDGDGLSNSLEWANSTDPLGSVASTWPKKRWPTDPGLYTNSPFYPLTAPNDPHPRDTDFDGLSDFEEGPSMTNFSAPTEWDTDRDKMPDGWEVYAGTQVLVPDAYDDPDGDGLPNWREYWTGSVPEWQLCDPMWDIPTFFCVRIGQKWDPSHPGSMLIPPCPYIPPDFLSDPVFVYLNDVITDLTTLRASYPAAAAEGFREYHTTLATQADSDYDGMDDFWEVYHALNPTKGIWNLMVPVQVPSPRNRGWPYGGRHVAAVDAAPSEEGFQFGVGTNVFRDLSDLLDYVSRDRTNRVYGSKNITSIIGPFNFGLDTMDPDGDGLPNLEEYSFSSNKPYYHTDPSPFWRTDYHSGASFANRNYSWDLLPSFYWFVSSLEDVFWVDQVDGFDTDNDAVGDYDEINAAAGYVGSEPLDARNPVRNRSIRLDGTNDFLREFTAWIYGSPQDMSKFSVEAWVCPFNPQKAGDQVVIEKAGTYQNPYTIPTNFTRANFRLGITNNGLPYILYNGRGGMTTRIATAQMAHRLKPNIWAHIAGTYDGTNLIIYVNGEASSSLYTTEIPATGNDEDNNVHPHNITVGASDLTAGFPIYLTAATPINYYCGLIDEVRIWHGARTRGEIIANKDRRLSSFDITNTVAIVTNLNTSVAWLRGYFSFDDVPDPRREGVVPAGMDRLDTTLSFHPTIDWWQAHPQRSTVYTGSVARPYNYLVTAEDHYAHRPVVPARDDFFHFSTNFSSNAVTVVTNDNGVVVTNYNAPSGYRNPWNPYGNLTLGQAWYQDLAFFRGARAVYTNSWLASLDPNDPDSTDSDGDGLPDWWEMLYCLNPNDATGDNGAWGDPDHDGLNNRGEYLAGTNPRMWDTDGDGISDYDSRRGPGSRTWGELYMAGDGIPDLWKVQYGLPTDHYIANQDPDKDGWDNYCEFMAGTDPNNPSNYPLPSVAGTAHYGGTNNLGYTSVSVMGMKGTNLFAFSSYNDIAGGVCDEYGNYTFWGLKQGPFCLFAFLDLDGNGSWNSTYNGTTYSTEPAGQSEENYYEMSWADISDTRVGVSDLAPGYFRLIWRNVDATSPDTLFQIGINKLSEAGAPQIFSGSQTVACFGEWNLQQAGIYGLGAGSYQWRASATGSNLTQLFQVTWPSSLSKPSLVYPRGDSLYYSRNMLQWTMDPFSTLYHLQVARQLSDGSYQMLADNYSLAPYREADGTCKAYLPEYAAAWGNGPLFWRIASWNPIGESEWSDVQTFNLELSATNSYWISGDIYYFGKARASNIYVEVYNNPGFGGCPEARVLYQVPCTTNPLKTSYTVFGLKNKIYYIRAFADITPLGGARNKQLDYWESWGFAKNASNDYYPRTIVMSNTHLVEDVNIIIRDRDTDCDHLPDAWEMSYFGNMDQTGDMDYDNDGEDNLTEYALDYLDTDPTLFDTDFDGLPDWWEHHYNNQTDYDPYDAVANPTGRSLNPTRWDTDGDGYSDGAEVRRYHTDPLNPGSRPFYAPPCYGPCGSPADFDGDGRSDAVLYDPAAGMWYLQTWQGVAMSGQFGSAVTQPLLGDFDGDGQTDAALFDPQSGNWYIYTMSGQFGTLNFGNAATLPVPADYDGDFRTDLGVYDATTGMWYLYSPFTGGFISYQFGNSLCIPVPGDFDGDAKADIAVYHVADNTWYCLTWRGQFAAVEFGRPGCIPIPADFDGDGRCDLALYEPATGMWHILASSSQQYFSGQFGWGGVIPVPGDYDGDGRRDAALYDPATGMWFIYTISGQQYQGQFGSPATGPVLGGR
jgi:hypothetical protein